MSELVCHKCGTHHFSEGLLGTQCPICPTLESLLGVKPMGLTVDEKAEREYWDNKRAGMRSVAGDIVARVLANPIEPDKGGRS